MSVSLHAGQHVLLFLRFFKKYSSGTRAFIKSRCQKEGAEKELWNYPPLYAIKKGFELRIVAQSLSSLYIK